MNKNLSELVFILDMSGSMYDLSSDTIGGFNSMLEKQKKLDGDAYVTTILFNTEMKVLHDRVPISQVKPMTADDYCADGCTALLDALGSSIRHIAKIHKYSPKEFVPGNTLFIINTDGMENSSRHYDVKRVRELISHEQEKYGWEFIFLGANIDAISTAAELGISADRTTNFMADAKGLKLAYDSLDTVVFDVRNSRPVNAKWKCAVAADHSKRNKK